MGRSIVLLGYVLIASGLLAQESQPKVNGTPQPHVFSIELTRVLGKPLSLKSSTEIVSSPQGEKLVRLRTEVMSARDSQGRIYSERRSNVPLESDQTPQIQGIYLIDPTAGTFTGCDISERRCVVSRLSPPGQASCSSLPVPDDVEIAWANLGEQNVGGIAVAHTRETCTHRRESSASGLDFWRNSKLGIELNVYTMHPKDLPPFPDWKVTDLSQAEPDPQLFAIPAGFAVSDSK
jgi:hypothetical protein